MYQKSMTSMNHLKVFPYKFKKLNNIDIKTPAYWLNIKTVSTKAVLFVDEAIFILTF